VFFFFVLTHLFYHSKKVLDFLSFFFSFV